MTKPLLVFGGPYSNLEATEALRRRADALAIPPSNVICTGDVVAYCAAPEETARLVADWGCHVIQGNCEQQLAVAAEDCACNFEEGTECAVLAKGWYPFANARMSGEMRAWMGALPETLQFNYGGRSFRVVHGGTEIVNRWVFQSERDVLAEEVARRYRRHHRRPFGHSVRRLRRGTRLVQPGRHRHAGQRWYGGCLVRPDPRGRQ